MIHNSVLDYLREMNIVSLLLRYLLAVLCGGLIGMERERRQRPAGLRTHILVCVGAATAFMISEYLVALGYDIDASRLAAQVISGIGFLGAGTIMVTRHQRVQGLTTAAGLWAAACMGLAIGAGFYEAALIGTVLIFFAAHLMIKLDSTVLERTRFFRMYIEFESAPAIGGFLTEMKNSGVKINSIDIDKNQEGQLTVAVAELECSDSKRHAEIVAAIRRLDGVMTVEEL